jgi:hypothetical protein
MGRVWQSGGPEDGRMAFVPEGQADSSQARGAWVAMERDRVPEGRPKSLSVPNGAELSSLWGDLLMFPQGRPRRRSRARFLNTAAAERCQDRAPVPRSRTIGNDSRG